MKTIGIIPARLQSTRLPRKLLKVIADKPLLEWTYLNACKSDLDEVVIACDCEEIWTVAQKFAETYMTSEHPCGTDRVAEVARNLNADVIVNIQGDEPLMPVEIINTVTRGTLECGMSTAASVYVYPEEISGRDMVKVVLDSNGYAIYFSRFPISNYKHLGIYAYGRDWLELFSRFPQSSQEKRENLEQLRWLQAGKKIKVFLTDKDSISVNTEEDLKKVEKVLSGKI